MGARGRRFKSCRPDGHARPVDLGESPGGPAFFVAAFAGLPSLGDLQLGTIRVPAVGEMVAERSPRSGDGPSIGVQVSLSGAQGSVAGDLASTCTGTPASAIQIRPVWRRSWRRRCSKPRLVTTSSPCVASLRMAVVIRPPRGPVNSLAGSWSTRRRRGDAATAARAARWSGAVRSTSTSSYATDRHAGLARPGATMKVRSSGRDGCGVLPRSARGYGAIWPVRAPFRPARTPRRRGSGRGCRPDRSPARDRGRSAGSTP